MFRVSAHLFQKVKEIQVRLFHSIHFSFARYNDDYVKCHNSLEIKMISLVSSCSFKPLAAFEKVGNSRLTEGARRVGRGSLKVEGEGAVRWGLYCCHFTRNCRKISVGFHKTVVSSQHIKF